MRYDPYLTFQHMRVKIKARFYQFKCSSRYIVVPYNLEFRFISLLAHQPRAERLRQLLLKCTQHDSGALQSMNTGVQYSTVPGMRSRYSSHKDDKKRERNWDSLQSTVHTVYRGVDNVILRGGTCSVLAPSHLFW